MNITDLPTLSAGDTGLGLGLAITEKKGQAEKASASDHGGDTRLPWSPTVVARTWIAVMFRWRLN